MRRIKRFNVPGIITRVLVGLRFYCIHIVPVLMPILFSGNSFSSSIVCICLPDILENLTFVSDIAI